MTVRVNSQLIMLSLGIIQPASPSAVAKFLSMSLLENSAPIEEQILMPLFEKWGAEGLIVRVHTKLKLFSLSSKGNHILTKEMRHLRDNTRLFLLKELRDGTLAPLGELGKEELTDASSVSLIDLVIQEEERPINPAVTLGKAQSDGRVYWPLLAKQLFVGSIPQSPSPRFRYGSFQSLDSCHMAHPYGAQENDFNLIDLSLCIGISPRLLSSFLYSSEHHYRLFDIAKKNGGTRTIRSPRVMLKTVQYWILDHLLHKLPIHDSCKSYRKGLSIFDNAKSHCDQNYVGNFDIKNFFPSITTTRLTNHFRLHGFPENASRLIAKLLTVNNELPQGAPTSPVVSNSYLFKFDEVVSNFSKNLELNYSRYADDVTISGAKRSDIHAVIAFSTNELARYELLLNPKKTRIAGRGSRQIVTGLVVNKVAQPPRTYRRQVRAMFDNAINNPEEFRSRLSELSGHLSYLGSFENLQNSQSIERYKETLKKLRTHLSVNNLYPSPQQ
ncbi:retron-type reverse transcriptase [Nitrosospira sp. Nsp5]|uniref:RNA-directed DNA polymerase n=1 Tax=Nitrosospira multiformis TaxID=1231 RepID=A0ABY0T6P4_9PROT|nr:MULTISPECIES: retron St85 family RNA-directed DNA polymerase [Nitrosospira]PTR07162.1 retron-type reverse transcriptase [Nitrosospira sp. Nsp5]SDQ34827.1 Retron-type reverse transcriptase [Nitrosospira multiformis]